MNEEQIAALQLKIKSLESTLNNVGAYVFTKDLQGCYTYANEKVLEIFAKPLAEVVGKDDSHFFDLEMSDQLRCNDIKVMQENISIESEEVNFIKTTGEMRVYKTVKKPLLDDDGKVIGLCGISTDITEQKQLETINKEQKNLLDTVLDNVDAYVYMKDDARRFRYVNGRVAELFGRSVDDIVGKLDTEVLPKEVADHFWASDRLVFETNARQEIEEEFANKNGTNRHYLSVKIPYQFADETKALIGFSSDITELYELKELYLKQANTDTLTGINNRRYFFENAEREFRRTQRYKLSLAVIAIDIDDFKPINDKYGHPVGDEVLKAVVKNIAHYVRAEDIFARIGGEEFSILLPETSADKARLVAQRICDYQRDSVLQTKAGYSLKLTLSLGVSSFREADESVLTLYARADKALYQAKTQGKNKVCYLA